MKTDKNWHDCDLDNAIRCHCKSYVSFFDQGEYVKICGNCGQKWQIKLSVEMVEEKEKILT